MSYSNNDSFLFLSTLSFYPLYVAAQNKQLRFYYYIDAHNHFIKWPSLPTLYFPTNWFYENPNIQQTDYESSLRKTKHFIIINTYQQTFNSSQLCLFSRGKYWFHNWYLRLSIHHNVCILYKLIQQTRQNNIKNLEGLLLHGVYASASHRISV